MPEAHRSPWGVWFKRYCTDGDVWTEDWTTFRSHFSFGDYNVAEGGSAPVPEPGTLAMLLAGLIGLAVAAWRRRA